MLAKRTQLINASPTLALNTKAGELIASGRDIIKFGVGEPDFPTPDHVKRAAIEAINENFTRYTPAAGIPALREAIAAKLRRDNGLEYKPAQIEVTVGGKHALFNAMMSLINDGDEVILPAPYWVSYPEQAKVTGGTPVVIPTSEETGFKLTADMLREAITPRTKLMVLNSPSNPSGAVYSREELEKLAAVCVENGIYVLSDEVYEKLVYDGFEHVSFASIGPEVKKLTVVINAVSKAYAMTGWRIGYAAAEPEIISAMNKLQSHVTSNATSISQRAALAAITGPQECVAEMVKAFDERRKYMVAALNDMPGITAATPRGAFYVFPNVSEWYGKRIGDFDIDGSDAFAEAMLEHAEIAIVPGDAFGSPDNVRFSYSNSMEHIKTGLARMKKVLEAAL